MEDPTWQWVQTTRLAPLLYMYSPRRAPLFSNESLISFNAKLLSESPKMGNCSSSDSTQVATAKLVLQDGRLQEFSYPVKVSYLLQEYPMSFICNSDEMDFDDVVAAIDEDEVLQPGQLYFALPLSRLRRPLQAQEMAALAVKASSALMKSGAAEKCGCRRKQILFSGEDNSKHCRSLPLAVGGGGGTVHRSRRGRSRNGGGKFTAMLNSIPE